MKAFIKGVECTACNERRRARHRVLTNLSDIPEEVRQPPYTDAPAIYSFNVPRYYSMQLRAREYAKQHTQQLAWCYAKDIPLHPGDRDLSAEKITAKLTSWLSRHDQETCHLPGLFGSLGWNADTLDGYSGPVEAIVPRPTWLYPRMDIASCLHSRRRGWRMVVGPFASRDLLAFP